MLSAAALLVHGALLGGLGGSVPEPPATRDSTAMSASDLAPTASTGRLVLAASSPPAVAEAAPIPIYRTEMPPAAMLRYAIGRGLLRGSAELTWQPEGGRYEFRLEAFLLGATILTQVSRGGFDAAGLAPLRFTDQRVRRNEEVANFLRDRGQITFSARPGQLALRPGAQDRLSWMIQLAAIAAANPALRREGAQVVMQVIGVHADASVWVLRCGGVERVRTDLGTVETLTFARVPDGPDDTAAQIWLDPKRHYLPVRATWRSGSDDEGMDMRLREIGK
ncbi:MAG TPA: DUF3108 domain-containing protein [Burkholderiaceae bacterium]|nr:DUF3108 domain-containing protein [Burkholderiaceae bacterium]